MPFGAELRDGRARFAIWAPAQAALALVLEGRDPLTMRPTAAGWYESVVSAQAGAHYQFALSDGTLVPDPASRYQPRDVEGPSELIDPHAYRWPSRGWRGRPWNDAILYELHLGTFTLGGTFRAAIEKLDHLAWLGVTALELMPIADFSGQRNWGYDGVLPFAPDATYGRPEDFKAFVDAAHARGLMVLLDVVYNHFGPVGNHLSAYAPRELSAHPGGRPRGEPSRHLPPAAFINFIQNHDQVGNRAFGERLAQLAQPEALRAVAAIYLLCPATPMLFMGEERGSVRSFTYFCDLPQLADAIREGRRKEFARFLEFESSAAREAIPDPDDPATRSSEETRGGGTLRERLAARGDPCARCFHRANPLSGSLSRQTTKRMH